jgi:hypothetical protein
LIPSRLTEYADKKLREEAIDNLTQKLQSGGTVGRNVDFTVILDCELNDLHRYPILLSELSALLQSSNRESAALGDKIRDGIIERYLNSPEREWLVSEEMGAIEYAAPEPDYYPDAREMGMA